MAYGSDPRPSAICHWPLAISHPGSEDFRHKRLAISRWRGLFLSPCNHLVQVGDRFLDPFMHELIRRKPFDTALPDDIAETENVFAERSLGFVETSRPDHVTPPHIDKLERERNGRRALDPDWLPTRSR